MGPRQQVILVDKEDSIIGVEEKMRAHQLGLLHRAFSVFIFKDPSQEQLLLQRRHPSKYHCGNLWTNTCCSHPRPGEDILEAAHRRLQEEMGFDTSLTEVGVFQYKASFENGLIENEIDHVFVGFSSIEKFSPHPHEVAEWKWLKIPQIKKELKENPKTFTPWFLKALTVALR